MEWLLLGIAAAGGVGTYGVRRVRAARDERQRRTRVLEQMRQIADEDVTVFGEQLQRLGDAVGEQHLDHDAQADYQRALDAYERAKWDAPRMEEPDEISRLVDTLATGRYAVACVRARMAGEPLPELRLPCFFNPQHGPSARDVQWTSARSGTKRVPACTRCAAQLSRREKPEVRTVQVGSRRVPYWEAGSSVQPYGRGYFPADVAGAATVAWAFTVPDFTAYQGGGEGWFGGYEVGGGFDGGFDGGGFDGGGGGDGGGSF